MPHAETRPPVDDASTHRQIFWKTHRWQGAYRSYYRVCNLTNSQKTLALIKFKAVFIVILIDVYAKCTLATFGAKSMCHSRQLTPCPPPPPNPTKKMTQQSEKASLWLQTLYTSWKPGASHSKQKVESRN